MSIPRSTDFRAAEPRPVWSHKVTEILVIGNGVHAAAPRAPVRQLGGSQLAGARAVTSHAAPSR